MKRHLTLPITTLVSAATLLSCSQPQKPVNTELDASEDTLSSAAVSTDSTMEFKKNYVDGYVFIYYVMCKSKDKEIHESISYDSFCFDNYEFPLTDCFSFLRDSDNVLYYCPPAQDDIVLNAYITKEQFQCATKAVKAYYDAPDSWIEGQEYVFVHRDHDDVKRIRKIRVQDPDAKILNSESKKTESLYGKYVYTVDETIFCGEELEVAPYSLDHSLTISDSGYFSKVNRKTGEATPTSQVEMCSEIPTFSYLFFIDDSTVVIDQTVYHKVEETVQVMYDSNVPAVQKALPTIDMPQYVSACRSAGTHVVTSDGGKYEYEIQLWKDTCDEYLDFIVFNKLLISCDNQIRESISDEFDWLGDSIYKADAAHPFYTFYQKNGCTLLMFQMNGRPNIPTLLVYALKGGTVTRAYCTTGNILSTKNENGSISFHLMTDQGEWGNRIMEDVYIYWSPRQYGDLHIRDGKLISRDFK